ncbi:MAG: hypothetical protein R8G34_17785 [Paracoccaceae bacterium]|nr:hypothetical protein [Paracoccaceae bacterium]
MSSPDSEAPDATGERARTGNAGHESGRYLAGAVDLQNSVDFNGDDAEFAKAHGEIRYVFDANVVRFFLNPFKSDEYLKISSLERPPVQTMQALATVTAEFLMSRQLAGQWGASPMISPAHAEEVADHARHLGQQARRQIEGSHTHEISRTIVRLMNSRKSESALREAIDETLDPLGGIGELLANEAFEAQEFTRVIHENLLRPLHLDDMASPKIMAVTADDTQNLRHHLLLHRTGGEKASTQRLVTRDAETLLQVCRLNVEAQRRYAAGKMRRRVRYVLVTSDQGLHNAAIDWLAQSDTFGGLDFPLRRLGQYIPFLNTKDMPNQVKSVGIFEDVKRAVTAFLLTVWGQVGQAPRPLPRWDRRSSSDNHSQFHSTMAELAEKMARRADLDPAYQKTLEELKKLWERLSRETVFLNAKLLGRRIEIFNALSNFLVEADDVRTAVLDLISDTLSGVELAHAKFSVQHTLAAIVEELREQNAHTAAPRRGVAVPLSRFQDVIEEPLFAFLTGFVAKPDTDRLDEIITKVETVKPHRAFFFAATVAFWASRWDSAEFFIDRALETAPSEPDPKRPHELIDLRYFAHVIRRFSILDMPLERPRKRLPILRNLVQPAWTLLHEAEDARSSFLICRSELELSMIYLSLAYGEHLERDQMDIPEANEAQKNSWEHVIRALEALAELEEHPDREVMHLLSVEMVISVSANILFERLYTSNKTDKKYVSEFEPFVTQIDSHLKRMGATLPEIYSVLPDIMQLIYETDKEKRREVAEDVMQRIAKIIATKGNATRMDQETSEVFNKKLIAFTMA